MQITKIYGLADPRTGHLRYVGKTVRSLKERLAGHTEVRHRKFHNARWVNSLWNKGLRPEIFLIEEVSGTGSDEERFYIAYFRSVGCDLTNATEGGEGWSPSAEIREKLRAAATGRTKSDATKQKLRDANLGKRMSRESVERTRAKLIGRSFSPETREKMRKAAANRDPAWRKRLSASAKATHFFSVLVRSARASVIP